VRPGAGAATAMSWLMEPAPLFIGPLRQRGHR